MAPMPSVKSARQELEEHRGRMGRLLFSDLDHGSGRPWWVGTFLDDGDDYPKIKNT